MLDHLDGTSEPTVLTHSGSDESFALTSFFALSRAASAASAAAPSAIGGRASKRSCSFAAVSAPPRGANAPSCA